MNVDEAILQLCEVVKETAGAGSAVHFKEFEPIRKLRGGFWVISSKGDKLYNVDEFGKCDCPAGVHRGKCRHGEKTMSHTPHGQLLGACPLNLAEALKIVGADVLEELNREDIISIENGVVDRL